METLLQGIILGLTLAGTCLATCGPIYAPFMIMEKRSFYNNLYIAFQISLGRFITYSIFGAVAGFLGTQLSDKMKFTATGISYIVLSAFLVIYMIQQRKPNHKECPTKKWIHLTKSSPILLGIITGISFCPSFLIALTSAFKNSGIVNGMLFFMAFFIGTSIIIVPISFMGFIPGLKIKYIKQVGYIATICVVIWFSITGAVMLYKIALPEKVLNFLKTEKVYIVARSDEVEYTKLLKQEMLKRGVKKVDLFNVSPQEAKKIIENIKTEKYKNGIIVTKLIFDNEIVQIGIHNAITKDNKSIIEVSSSENGNDEESIKDVIAKLEYYDFKGIDKGFIFKTAN